MNKLENYKNIFDGIVPWSGRVAPYYTVDFLGVRIDSEFCKMWSDETKTKEERHVTTRLPPIGDGHQDEYWFEAANWVMAAREARGSFVMMTLGAHYGYQAAGTCAALRLLNPMPFKLVAVDAGPENCAWVARHFKDNGITPDQYWILQMALSGNNEPVFFPVGSSGSGSNSSSVANESCARNDYLRQFSETGTTQEALANLLLRNTTGIVKNVIPGMDTPAEIKLVSAMTLGDLLGPFARVDYLEADIQRAEMEVFPPFMDLLKRKVKRIHLGTHGKDAHELLHNLFVSKGWEIIFSFEGESSFDTALGTFLTNDGILTVLNPDL